MVEILKKIIQKSPFHSPLKEKGSVEAYDIWSENYDAQPGNLMMDLDEEVFSALLNGVVLKDKHIADIGCGTGRHWSKLFAGQPLTLTGFDVSQGMLNRLQQKFPQANIYQIRDNVFTDIPGSTYDAIVSTLTVAHIEDIEEALKAWSRMLKAKSDLIITDFHPNALAFGGKRTFAHGKTQIAVQN